MNSVTAQAGRADYAWAVLALILAWAKGRGIIDVYPCLGAGKLYNGARADKVWRAEGSDGLSQGRVLSPFFGFPDGRLDGPAPVRR
jgi:hypothetical protein